MIIFFLYPTEYLSLTENISSHGTHGTHGVFLSLRDFLSPTDYTDLSDYFFSFFDALF
jgi:hypothetical protein